MLDITPVILAFIGLCVAAASAVAIPWAYSAFSAEKFTRLTRYVEIGVKAAEQLGFKWSGADRKQYVLDFLAKKGFKVDADEVDKAIEAAVLELHSRIYTYYED